MIELVAAIVVISVALTGTILLAETTTRHSASPMLGRQAVSIAEAYLEEALAKPYLDPEEGTVCPTPEATRDLYDNVCDYDGLDETGPRNPLGTEIDGLDGYRIELDVDTSAQLGEISGVSDVLRVDATVTDPLGRKFVLSGYRTNS